jgi:hypothetical protein
MKNSRKMELWIAAVVCLLVPIHALAGNIAATGGWTRTIDSSDLSSGPGSDLNPSYESAANATSLDLTSNSDYRVDVRRTDSAWSGAFTLYIQRTSDGIAGHTSSTISGGTAYQSVSTSDGEFFIGYRDRIGVEVQYRVDGVSVSIGPDTYSSTITFTIVDL